MLTGFNDDGLGRPPGIDPRDCTSCGALYLGPTCLECSNWKETGLDEMRLGYRPLFTLSEGQIRDQLAKSMREMSHAY